MTKIEWTDQTWNPVVGCSEVSPGCANCYAREAARSRRLQQFPQYQTVKAWNGTVEFVESQLLKPVSWKSPQMIFVCSMADLFHNNVPDEWIDKVMAIAAICPRHTFQILTKRPERMRAYFADPNRARWICDRALDLLRDEENPLKWKLPIAQFEVKIPLPNVWLGTTVENRKAIARIPAMRDTPSVLRFLSCEPLLEDLGDLPLTGIDWVIVGGESGSRARLCKVEWIRAIVEQCDRAGTPVFVKQPGCNTDASASRQNKLELLPDRLQLQQFPEVYVNKMVRNAQL